MLQFSYKLFVFQGQYFVGRNRIAESSSFFFLLSHHSVLVLYKEYKCIHIKSFTEPEDWVKCSLFQLVQVNVCGPFHLIPETREF